MKGEGGQLGPVDRKRLDNWQEVLAVVDGWHSVS